MIYEVEVGKSTKADVFYIVKTDVPGLHLESDTAQGMVECIIEFTPEAMQCNLRLSPTEIENATLKILFNNDASNTYSSSLPSSLRVLVDSVLKGESKKPEYIITYDHKTKADCN